MLLTLFIQEEVDLIWREMSVVSLPCGREVCGRGGLGKKKKKNNLLAFKRMGSGQKALRMV